MVKSINSKLNFAIQKNISKQFQEENKPDGLMRTMCLLGIGIILTQARQIVIINLDYNGYLSNQAEKKISWIR